MINGIFLPKNIPNYHFTNINYFTQNVFSRQFLIVIIMPYMFKCLLFCFCFCGFTFFIGCIDCGCEPDTPPFFDYHFLSIQPNSTQFFHMQNSGLELEASIDSIEFLAESVKTIPFIWASATYACSCEEPGDHGNKYPITSIDVWATPSFRNDLDRTNNINHFFYTEIRNRFGTHDIPLAEDTLYPLAPFNRYYNESFLLQTDSIPDVAGTYQFTITITKSNGEALTTQTEPITWEE